MKTAGIARKNRVLLLTSIISFACCSISNADITSASWYSSGNGGLVCESWGWTPGTSTLWMYGGQSSLPAQQGPGVPAQMLGTIHTTDPLDPTLFLGSSVDNDSGGIWNGYQVNVIMSVPFTFSGSAGVSTVPADSWFVAGTTAPTLQASGPYAGLYEGTMLFSAGTPVMPGGELDFNYAIHFANATTYSFTQEMIPLFSEVPEPSTLVLVGMGGLVLALRLHRNRRKGA